MKPFQIFRAGRHTPMSGPPITFGESELEAAAAAYDPALHEAPIVIGHPKSNGPAFGWVEALKVEDGHLLAVPRQVDPDFCELVERGAYKKVSAAFYRPDSAGNPTPGSYYLRHVGFLGALPPAVKGLRPVEFGEDCDTVEFADWHTSFALGAVARVLKRIRDWMIEDKGLETADRIIPGWDVDELQRAAIQIEPEPGAAPVSAFGEISATTTEDTSMTDTAALAADLERQASELAIREAAFAERERKAKALDDAAFVQRVNAEGRLPAGLVPTATALFGELGADDTVEFGEGGARTSPRQLLRDLLENIPQPVSTDEIGGGAGPTVDFADPVALAEALVIEVETARAKGETISPADALNRVHKGA
ncbi:MAG: hypothetical protein B7Y70_16100 [Rhizobiales bacterium 35-68-8]|nr:MAG: hypothetical protein B7Y70_16100 [Rhizobiales bacterium 35-68-8]